MRSRVKQLWLFLVGIAFIGFWLLLAANIESIAVEVLSIIGSFAIWEAANIWIVEAPKMRIHKRLLERLKNTRIEFDASATST